MTDLATVLFGLGVFNANNSFMDHERVNRRGDEIERIGYLTPTIWAYALALWLHCWPNRDPPGEIGSALDFAETFTVHSPTFTEVRTRTLSMADSSTSKHIELLKIAYPQFPRSKPELSKEVDPRDDGLPEKSDDETTLDDEARFDDDG